MNTLPADVLRLTYGYLDDADLANACMVDKNFAKKICNKTFWRNKLIEKYNFIPGYLEQHIGDKTYWGYYLHLSKYLDRDLNLVSGLFNAMKDGAIDVVSLILDIDKEWEDRDLLEPRDYRSSLSIAVYNGHSEAVKLFIDKLQTYRFEVITQVTLDNSLYTASEKGHSDVINVLLDAGANVHNGADRSVKIAYDNKHYYAVYTLIKRGASVPAGLTFAASMAGITVASALAFFLREK